MKKVLLTVIAAVVVLGIASAGMAELKETTKTNKAGTKSVTKLSGNVEGYKIKGKLVRVENGKFTTDHGKVVATKHPGHVVQEIVHLKSISNPKSGSTIAVIKDKDVVKMNYNRKNIKVNELQKVRGQKIKVYSSFGPDGLPEIQYWEMLQGMPLDEQNKLNN